MTFVAAAEAGVVEEVAALVVVVPEAAELAEAVVLEAVVLAEVVAAAQVAAVVLAVAAAEAEAEAEVPPVEAAGPVEETPRERAVARASGTMRRLLSAEEVAARVRPATWAQ